MRMLPCALCTIDLPRPLQNPAPTLVQVYKDGAFSSAQQLAEQLNSSLERGLCEDAPALGRRAAAFGVNRLPERAQVGMPHSSVS